MTLFRSLAGLVRAWWTADRVRVPAPEGRLLRLAAGSAIRVRGQPAVVASRRVGRTADGPYVIYECDGVAGRSLLRLRPIGGTGRVNIQWTANGKEVALTEDEVDAYPVTRGLVLL